jgi:hypothetical protein
VGIEEIENPESLFHRYFDQYFITKQRNEKEEVRLRARLSLAQIDLIAGGFNRRKALRVVTKLLCSDISVNEGAIPELYDELREDRRNA